ncbi:MAG: hypothetical protein D6B25_01040 [Desulfobulbaceae bacterium]|nr:MAG: hypothetical protein D6B25_01040 [Desulfobulbaceae bacterium]
MKVVNEHKSDFSGNSREEHTVFTKLNTIVKLFFQIGPPVFLLYMLKGLAPGHFGILEVFGWGIALITTFFSLVSISRKLVVLRKGRSIAIELIRPVLAISIVFTMLPINLNSFRYSKSMIETEGERIWSKCLNDEECPLFPSGWEAHTEEWDGKKWSYATRVLGGRIPLRTLYRRSEDKRGFKICYNEGPDLDKCFGGGIDQSLTWSNIHH